MNDPLIDTFDFGPKTTADPEEFTLSLTSSEAQCPIESYQATSTPTNLYQLNCLSPDTSVNCRKVRFPLNSIRTDSVTYELKLKGGNTMNYYVNLDVICSTYVSIIRPSELYSGITEYD